MAMKELLFDSWDDWKTGMVIAFKKLIASIIGILAYTIFGIASLIRWLWRLLVVFVKRYTVIAIVVFSAIIIITWLITFVSMRHRAVGAEHQRDSLSYELSKFTQMYDDASTKVVISDDTVDVKWK